MLVVLQPIGEEVPESFSRARREIGRPSWKSGERPPLLYPFEKGAATALHHFLIKCYPILLNSTHWRPGASPIASKAIVERKCSRRSACGLLTQWRLS
jgi:hypothetical protein